MAGKLTVTLRRSPIGEKPKTRLVVAGLGLGKLNSTRVLPDNPSTRGAIHKVRHLVEVEEERDQGSEIRGEKKSAKKAAKKAVK
jgi:large subunit ribosomal protein L30